MSYYVYIGVTDDLMRRLQEHRNDRIDGFTKTYHVHKLVYYETFFGRAVRHRPREAAEGLAAIQEGRPDRERQPRMGGPGGGLVHCGAHPPFMKGAL